MVIAREMRLRSYLKRITINKYFVIMKKNIVIVLMCSVLLLSCFSGNCVEYVIENKTDKNLEIISFSGGSIKKNRNILSNDIFVEMKSCSSHWGEDVRYDAISYTNDSMQVKSDGILVKTYYPDDKGNSIYKNSTHSDGEEAVSCWKVVEDRKSYRKYVFEITEEDLK